MLLEQLKNKLNPKILVAARKGAIKKAHRCSSESTDDVKWCML
jgi:hypothetical protein